MHLKTVFLYKSNLQYSHKEYSERTKSTYEIYDSILGKNVFRVYPENYNAEKAKTAKFGISDLKNLK